MALITRIEFAKMCGMANNALAVYIKRRKLIVEGNKVDTELDINVLFLSKYNKGFVAHENIKQYKDPIELDPVVSPTTIVEATARKTPLGFQQGHTNNKSPSLFNMDQTKKQLDIDKITVEIRLKLLDEAKKRGEIIPIDLIKVIISQQSQSIITSFKDNLEDIITIFGKSKGMNVNEIAEMRGSITKTLNIIVNKAVDNSKRNIKNIIDEYSLKKNVGEHD